jgi:hypothetical protein
MRMMRYGLTNERICQLFESSLLFVSLNKRTVPLYLICATQNAPMIFTNNDRNKTEKTRTHLFPLLIKIPPMQSTLPAKLEVRLRLQQRDLSYGAINEIVVWFQTKGLDDEFPEIIVVRWRQSLLSPSFKKGIRVEGRRALG